MLFFPRCVEREHTNMQSYLRLRPQAQTSNDYLLKPAHPLRNGERVPISPHPGWFPGTSRDFIKNHLLPKIISKQSLFKKKKRPLSPTYSPHRAFPISSDAELLLNTYPFPVGSMYHWALTKIALGIIKGKYPHYNSSLIQKGVFTEGHSSMPLRFLILNPQNLSWGKKKKKALRTATARGRSVVSSKNNKETSKYFFLNCGVVWGQGGGETPIEKG